jgi:hypothetical protein
MQLVKRQFFPAALESLPFLVYYSFWFSETHVMLLEACGASHLFITLGQTLLLTFVLLCVSLLARLQMNLEHAKLQLNARHHIKSPISLPPPCALLPF